MEDPSSRSRSRRGTADPGAEHPRPAGDPRPRPDRATEAPRSGDPDGSPVLRDELAIERTLLASERTLLSYLRAGVSLLIAGASIMHFASQKWFFYLGATCMPFGIATTVFGAARFVRQRRAIGLVRTRREREGSATPPAGARKPEKR